MAKKRKRKRRLLVSSDGHGRYYEFISALKKSKYDSKYDTLIYLGDAIDRGPHGKKFLRKLMQLEQKDGAIVLLGNHELMFLDTILGNFPLMYYIKNGGLPTLKSFGIDIEKRRYTQYELFKIIGEDLINWLLKRPLYYQTDRYIFVHAGIKPDIPINKQSRDDLLWIREDFYMNYKGEKIVFFGHTATKRICRNNGN